MMMDLLRSLFCLRPAIPEEQALDGAYMPVEDPLAQAGLDERRLRRMKPDDRVRVLEQANLDPYDYLYLCC